MAKLSELINAIKNTKLETPWSLLPKTTAYEQSKHQYALRATTKPITVTLYQPIINAACRIGGAAYTSSAQDRPFRMIERKKAGKREIFVETGLEDGTSFLVMASDTTLRISSVETDGTRSTVAPFKSLNENCISSVALALMPLIMDMDSVSGGMKICNAITDLCTTLSADPSAVYLDKNDIPDLIKDSVYFLDAALSVIKDKMDKLDCGDKTSDVPAELEDAFFSKDGKITGSLLEEYLQVPGNPVAWQPLVLTANKVSSVFAKKNVNIGDAKKMYASFMAHRKWTQKEKELIPDLPDDVPVMKEILRFAHRLTSTANDVDPVKNITWRGGTGYGKSYGVRQLACILNMPLLTITCSSNMEESKLTMEMVPDASTDGFSLNIDQLTRYGEAIQGYHSDAPYFEEAMAHFNSLAEEEKKQLLDGKQFFSLMVMDADAAVESLVGRPVQIDLEEIGCLYTDMYSCIREQPLRQKLATLEALNESEGKTEQKDQNAPSFVAVPSPYLLATVNGYLIELQEASRIRDSGILVSLNEFSHPGGKMQLINGYTAIRHKDAICITTDNVGYCSCRPVDNSVIRRNAVIHDSWGLSEEDAKARVKRNTGITDMDFLDQAYKLWDTVKTYCEHNNITEGSVSPVEFERFVQACIHDNFEYIEENLDDCIISKATSSLEDQRDIRTACMTLIAGF